jgi:hypothetical protein
MAGEKRREQAPVGASLLAMVVNGNALSQMPRGVLGFFASRLAPTVGDGVSLGQGRL